MMSPSKTNSSKNSTFSKTKSDSFEEGGLSVLPHPSSVELWRMSNSTFAIFRPGESRSSCGFRQRRWSGGLQAGEKKKRVHPVGGGERALKACLKACQRT
jgi:hypothetical protein